MGDDLGENNLNNDGVLDIFNPASSTFRISQQDIDSFCRRQQQPHNLLNSLQKQMNCLEDFGIFVMQLRKRDTKSTGGDRREERDLSADRVTRPTLIQRQMNYNEDLRTFVEIQKQMADYDEDFRAFVEKLIRRRAEEEVNEEINVVERESGEVEQVTTVSRSGRRRRSRVKRVKREKKQQQFWRLLRKILTISFLITLIIALIGVYLSR